VKCGRARVFRRAQRLNDPVKLKEGTGPAAVANHKRGYVLREAWAYCRRTMGTASARSSGLRYLRRGRFFGAISSAPRGASRVASRQRPRLFLLL
jgi:hypothetical protein